MYSKYYHNANKGYIKTISGFKNDLYKYFYFIEGKALENSNFKLSHLYNCIIVFT